MSESKAEKLERLKKQKDQITNQIKLMEQQQKQKLQKERNHRLIEIGASVESALGFEVTKEMLPSLIKFIKDQEDRGNFISKAIKTKVE